MLKKLHFPCRMASPSEKISKVMMEKNLRLNEDKCVVITIGTKKQREETKIQLKTNPIMCGKSEMKQAEKEKWLFQNSRSRLEKRDHIKGILVLVSKPESEDNKSRSGLDARDWRKFFLSLVSKPESKCQEFSVLSR